MGSNTKHKVATSQKKIRPTAHLAKVAKIVTDMASLQKKQVMQHNA